MDKTAIVWSLALIIIIGSFFALGYYLGYQRLVDLPFLSQTRSLSPEFTKEERATTEKFFGTSSPRVFSPSERATMDKFFGN